MFTPFSVFNAIMLFLKKKNTNGCMYDQNRSRFLIRLNHLGYTPSGLLARSPPVNEWIYLSCTLKTAVIGSTVDSMHYHYVPYHPLHCFNPSTAGGLGEPRTAGRGTDTRPPRYLAATYKQRSEKWQTTFEGLRKSMAKVFQLCFLPLR